MKIEIHIHNHECIPSELLHKLQFITRSMSCSIESLTRALEIGGAQPRSKESLIMPDLQAVIDDLIAKWNQLKALVDQSETVLVGIPQRIADAVAQAQAAGATPEQLQALTDLAAAISTETSELTAAIAAQAPPAPPDNGPEA